MLVPSADPPEAWPIRAGARALRQWEKELGLGGLSSWSAAHIIGSLSHTMSRNHHLSPMFNNTMLESQKDSLQGGNGGLARGFWLTCQF